MSRPLSDLKYIVIHHTVTEEDATVQQIRQMHLNKGYWDVGYHYLISPAKGMLVGRDINATGAHALSEKPGPDGKLPPLMNYYGIGISLIGDYSKAPPSDKTINELAYLIKRLAAKPDMPNIKISRDRIIPHYAVDYTACPGQWTMEMLYKKLKI